MFTSFIYDDISEIFLNLVDAFFKVVESILFIRIIADFFQLSKTSSFLDIIYSFTNWSSGIFPDLIFFDGRLNISAIIVLIGIILFDLVSESILVSLFFKTTAKKTKKVTVKSTIQPQPVHQNITINLPPVHQLPSQKAPQQRPLIPKSVSVLTVPKSINTTNNYHLPLHPNNYYIGQNQTPPQKQQPNNRNAIQKAWSRVKEFFRS
ncbi:MAG: hypothetical protein Kow0081_0100 [Candidatus Dojkabacteria bacterium]